MVSNRNGEHVHYGEPLYWNKPNLFRLDGIDDFRISAGQHDLTCTYWNGAEPTVLYDTKLLSAFIYLDKHAAQRGAVLK